MSVFYAEDRFSVEEMTLGKKRSISYDPEARMYRVWVED